MKRQQIWQEKMLKEGRCRVCGKPAVSKNFCQRHDDIAKSRARNRYRKKVGLPVDAPLHTRVKNYD